MINHHPCDQGVWFPYNKTRYKDYYDLRLKDGTTHRVCFPNGGGWRCPGVDRWIEDDEIEAIKLLTDKELPPKSFTGEQRIARAFYFHGGFIPTIRDPMRYSKKRLTPETVEYTFACGVKFYTRNGRPYFPATAADGRDEPFSYINREGFVR